MSTRAPSALLWELCGSAAKIAKPSRVIQIHAGLLKHAGTYQGVRYKLYLRGVGGEHVIRNSRCKGWFMKGYNFDGVLLKMNFQRFLQ